MESNIVKNEEFIDSVVNFKTEDQIIANRISKNIRELDVFLKKFITEKGNQKTNIINVADKKTYFVPLVHLENLFILLDKCRKERHYLHYSERQESENNTNSGIMIDFDIYQTCGHSLINNTILNDISTFVGKIIFESVDFKDKEKEFHLFVIKKPEVVLYKDEPITYKDGIHLLIPEIQINKSLKKHIFTELINGNILQTIFKSLIPHLVGSIDKIIDMMSISNPVHFYGNCKPKNPQLPCYKLHSTYLVSQGINNIRVENKTINEDEFNLTYELSLSFNLDSITRTTFLKKRNYEALPEIYTKIQLITEKITKTTIDEDDILQVENSVDILTIGDADAGYLKNLLAILDISYAVEYEKWIKVIFAIANTSTRYKSLAEWFSRRSPKSWNRQEFERIWEEAVYKRADYPITKRSIIFWAKSSSPDRFAEINKDNYIQILAKSAYENEGRVGHAWAAKVIHSMLSDKFVCDTIEAVKGKKSHYSWYEFVVGGQSMKPGQIFKWRLEGEPDNMHLFIVEHLTKIYDLQLARIRDRKEAADKDESKYWANIEKTFKKCRSDLANDTTQNGIISQSKYRFRVRGFIDQLDSYPNIIGVGNGILKIGPKPELIRGFHEYRISKYTETEYQPDLYKDKVKILLNAFHDIYPEEDVFLFVMCLYASWLDYREANGLMLLNEGAGQNGKTTPAKIVHNTLGNMYVTTGKSALLTSAEEKGNESNSAQMAFDGMRGGYFDEFKRCEVLNDKRIKACCSPGWQSGRNLYESQKQFKNTCNFIAFSNFDFIIDTTDHGLWRRIYYYKSKVKFTSNPSPNNPFEKLENKKFLDEYANDPEYKSAMLTILVHYYTIYATEFDYNLKNIPVPTIWKETAIFRNRQDKLNCFISQMIIKMAAPTSENEELTTLTINSIALKYIEWYNKMIGKISLSITAVITDLENSRLSSLFEAGQTIKVLRGYRIKSDLEDNIKDGEEFIPERYIDNPNFNKKIYNKTDMLF